MNQKRTFGSILTVLGIIGIILGALGFLAVGLIFFFAGINLVKTTSDRA
jgi:multisubunit Na+/H+ antiporter MnhG subunit